MFEVLTAKASPWKCILRNFLFQPFLRKEWLVKTNSSSSTPYLFVSAVHAEYQPRTSQDFRNLFPLPSIWHALCYSRIPNPSGVKVITTRNPTQPLLILYLGSELTGQQIARRWRECNPRAPPPFITREDEDEWRASILELLKKAHTIGGVNAFTFEVAHTDFSVSLPSSTSSPIVNIIILGYGLLTPRHFSRLEVGDLFCRLQTFRRHNIPATRITTHQRKLSLIYICRICPRYDGHRCGEGLSPPLSFDLVETSSST